MMLKSWLKLQVDSLVMYKMVQILARNFQSKLFVIVNLKNDNILTLSQNIRKVIFGILKHAIYFF